MLHWSAGLGPVYLHNADGGYRLLDPEEHVTVAVADFLADGGDDFSMLLYETKDVELEVATYKAVELPAARGNPLPIAERGRLIQMPATTELAVAMRARA